MDDSLFIGVGIELGLDCGLDIGEDIGIEEPSPEPMGEDMLVELPPPRATTAITGRETVHEGFQSNIDMSVASMSLTDDDYHHDDHSKQNPAHDSTSPRALILHGLLLGRWHSSGGSRHWG